MGKGGQKMAPAESNRHDFYRSLKDEPHVVRRREILKAHPEIEQLFGPDWRMAPFATAMVVTNLVLASYAPTMSWPVFFLCAYVISGTLAHSLSLAIHEASHSLIFENRKANEYFGIFCNLGIGMATSVTFKRYHMEHHQFQGVEGKDVDVATAWEGEMFRSPVFKLLFLLLLPLSYGVRPLIISPKSMNFMEFQNILAVAAMHITLAYYCGPLANLYFVVASALGHGLHPMSGHFIAEHYVYTEGQETYSYYGPLNYLAWNVGYHNEHHDFPRVPGVKLPQVKALAPEYYENLASYDSWPGVLYRFVVDPCITPYNRVVRASKYSGR
mmetsp:Transcript_15517/g.34258  ORF Transcript_15517/g.34258 Transcript_15517/m.34258 type:complete len:328 (-) Transcript_15517:289-1272(-)|eukprot:CAMPEP_0173177958 /NCGR_PEP_ID=MMETSP1141-20130122/5267_1 /TAXON_ID=483371 /ORGANISM="non described non described, Strain CCMP2298" /LENGTH=327 /DNA_ID=CAMNT_0014100391 /DNA_START=97 /DNA_END=1080 /DNA_ORIENTATION=+